MKKIILIRGPICAGKSTVVNLLRQNIPAASMVDMDVFKRAIDHTESFRWRTKMAFKIALFMAEQIMKKDRVVIADIHATERYQYEAYKKLSKRFKCQLYSFLLYPPLETCLTRNKKRNIPDVKYKISKNEIIRYWANPYRVKNEAAFDSNKLTAKTISSRIINIVNRQGKKNKPNLNLR